MQWTLRDYVTKEALNTTQIGSLTEASKNCTTFGFNVTTDFLRNIIVGYNSTGVYGIQLETGNNLTYASGLRINDKSLKNVTFRITIDQNGVRSQVFVGFDGT